MQFFFQRLQLSVLVYFNLKCDLCLLRGSEVYIKGLQKGFSQL